MADRSVGGSCVIDDAQQENVETTVVPEEVLTELRAMLRTQYPYPAATAAPSKQTATQRKGRVKDLEVAENAAPPKMQISPWRTPSFAGKKVHGKERGNAIHAAMQYIRYEV